MNKNSFLHSKVLRSKIAVFAIVCMLVGFFVSRAMLSMSMMLFGLNGLLGVHPKKWLKEKWWLLGAIWVGAYFISGLWSSDMEYWNTRCEVKLPILLLPLAFAFTPTFQYRQQKIFTLILNGILLFGVGYSLSFLFRDPDFYIKGYDYSNVLPTLPKNNHIVFSLSMAAAIIWNIYFQPFITERWFKWFNMISVVIMMVMLHVLAARTGLVALYVFIACWSCYLTLKKRTRFIGISMLILFFAAGLAAFKYIPTLSNRLEHFNYTIQMFREGNMSGDYSDIGRYMSYDITLKIIAKHPLIGVGAGEMLDSMKEGYNRWYPQVPEEQRLIPHNQLFTVALGCGIPAALFFVAWVLYPLLELRRNRAGFFFLTTWLIMLIPLTVEPILEIQFGVFVYLFFLLWLRHVMLKQPQAAGRFSDELTRIT